MGIGDYPTGEKHDGGLKEILAIIGVLTAVGGAGMVIAKKYDIGMDDISATIAYLEAKTFGTPSKTITTSDSQSLAPTPAPTYTPAAKNGSSTAITPKSLTREEIQKSDVKYVLDKNPQYGNKGMTIDGTLFFAPKEYRDTLIKVLAFYEKFSSQDYQFLKEHNKIYIYDQNPSNGSIAGSSYGSVGFAKYVGDAYPQLKNINPLDGKHNLLLIAVLDHEGYENLIMEQEPVNTIHTPKQQAEVDKEANIRASLVVSNLSKAIGTDTLNESFMEDWVNNFDIDEYLKQKNVEEVVFS